MSNSQDKSKSTPATIKIAAKDASQRGSGGTDPGPGDPEAQPSEMPEPVSVPAPPSPSELVVKSLAKSTTAGSRAIKTINDPVSLPKSKGSSASTSHLKSLKTAPTADENAPRESTSSKALSSNKMGAESGGFQEGASTSGIASRLNVKSVHSSGKMGNAPNSTAGGSQSRGNLANVKTIDSAQNGPSASQAMQADSMAVPQEQDVVEEVGQTEVEQPESPSPGTADQGASPAASQGSASPASSNAGSAQVSPSVGGSIKMQSKVLGHKGSSASREANQHHASRHKKKTSKFRYHKRVTVRTHGKTSPSTVMDKVNMKDHKAGLTPSSIGEMDQEELMKRAGIKGGKKTHWRVRLRQTKRTTKDGKTTTQTKVAYRDSEGNKRIKTSSTPECPKCGKKLEDCRCDE